MREYSRVRLLLWAVMCFVAVQFAFSIAGFVWEGKFEQPFAAKFAQMLSTVRWHGVFGAVALLTGALQLAPARIFHRQLGWLYAVAVFLSSLLAFKMALVAEGGWVARCGFLTQDCLWLGTLLLGIRGPNHGAWMTRNYALTFAAVNLRLLLYSSPEGVDFWEFYRLSAWFSWLPNLVVAEVWLRWRSVDAR